MPTFMLLNGGAALVAILVAAATGRGARTSAFLLNALCAYLVLIHSTVLVSGLAGWLTAWGAAALLAATLAGAAWLARRASKASVSDTNVPPPFAAPELYAVLAAIAAGALWARPHLWEATRLWIWDDYTYHMVYPTLWLREHAITAADPAHAFTMQAWYPLGASLVAVWFMLPFHGVRGEALAWVSLTGPLYAAIIACGAVVLLARVGCRPGAWATPAVLLLTSHRIGVMASSFSDADLATAASLFAAFVFAVPRGDTEEARDTLSDTWYAALLSGIALGIKVSAVISALIIFGMVLRRVVSSSGARPARLRAAARVASVFAVSWAATGGYWYARNAFHTGNPLYPAAFLWWPGSTFPETTLREYGRQYGLMRALADALAVYMNWPLFHAVIAAVGLVGLAGWLLWRRGRLTRPQAYFGLGTVLVASAILALLPATPYSAGNPMTFRSGFVHWDSMRYVALLPILGWVGLGFLVDAGPGAARWRGLAAVSITSAALLISADPLLRSPAVPIALALCAGIASRLALRRRHWWSPTTNRNALAAGAMAVLLAAMVLWRHDAKTTVTAAAIYREPLFGGAAAVLDSQPRGTRVAIFGDQWVFPAFGDRDHLSPVRPDRDGRVASAPIGDAMEPGPLAADPATFLQNLRAAGVHLVLVLHLPHPGRSTHRPTQEAALETASGAHLAYRGEAATVWTIARAQETSRCPLDSCAE